MFDTLVLPSDVNVGLETPLMGNLWKIYGKYGKIVYKPYEYCSYISYIYNKPQLTYISTERYLEGPSLYVC